MGSWRYNGHGDLFNTETASGYGHTAGSASPHTTVIDNASVSPSSQAAAQECKQLDFTE